MARTARASQGGILYHVLNRGNGRGRVFKSDEDYAVRAGGHEIREGRDVPNIYNLLTTISERLTTP